MDHLAWALVLFAMAILGATVVYASTQTRRLRFHIERHGLRLRGWKPVSGLDHRAPHRCPECKLTAHGHWAKIGHQRWHDEQAGRLEAAELWDSASAEFIADRDAGTPELPHDAAPEGVETDAISAPELREIEQ